MTTTNGAQNPKRHRPFGYILFQHYVKAVVDGLYYRKVFIIGKENLPESGTPTVLVSNHQNCLNDPLALALLFKDRLPRFLARANVFGIHPVANKFLRYLGMLPVYRAGYEGTASLANNDLTFSAASDALKDGQTVVLYPECGHQDKRWLGNYSVGYLKLAFLAASKMDFKKDVQILPSCNHYSNYFHMRTDMLIKFGKPISLQPFYELYKKEPRKAMRKVNEIVKESVSGLMLNITDLEHYEDVDFLRESEFGKRFAESIGLDSDRLPDKLKSDKLLFEKLENAKNDNPEHVEGIYRDISKLRKTLQRLKLRDWLFEKEPGLATIVLESILMIIACPIFLISMIPNGIVFLLPEIAKGKMLRDIMFFGSFNIGISVFLTIPLCYIAPTVFISIFAGFTYGIAYLIACPLLLIFAWKYMKQYLKLSGKYRFYLNRNSNTITELRSLRERIHRRLNVIFEK